MSLMGSCRMVSYLLKICLVALDTSYLIGALLYKVPIGGLDVWLTLLLPLLLAL
jgi:hypothetical protein